MSIHPIKMVVTDLDGTLFRSDKSISEYSKNVIQRCRENGILFVVATARMKRLVDHFLHDIALDGCIYHNGASVFLHGKEIASHRISSSAVQRVLGGIRSARPDAQLAVQARDTFFTNFDAVMMTKAAVMIQRPISELPACDADKINVLVSGPAEAKEYERFLDDELYIVCSENAFGMVMHKDATKLNGIRAIAEAAHIPMLEIAAFGDDYNDLDMLSGCGIGVAMGNAVDEVKLLADDICQDNDSDGVANWLEVHLLSGN